MRATATVGISACPDDSEINDYIPQALRIEIATT
jgi:hypothetical protein